MAEIKSIGFIGIGTMREMVQNLVKELGKDAGIELKGN